MREVTTLPACLASFSEAVRRVLLNPDTSAPVAEVPGCIRAQCSPVNPDRAADIRAVAVANLVAAGRRREAEMMIGQWRGTMSKEDCDLLASLVGASR